MPEQVRALGMLAHHVADLVADHPRQLILGAAVGDQSPVNEDVAVRHGEGVHRGLVDHVEVVVLSGVRAHGDQPLADLVHVGLPLRIVVETAVLEQSLIHVFAGAGLSEGSQAPACCRAA